MSLFMQDVPGMQAGLYFGAADKGHIRLEKFR